MITAAQIAPLRRAAPDRAEAARLIECFATLRQTRDPLYLASNDLDQILRWKLRGQYGRQAQRRAANTENLVRLVTQAAFAITHSDSVYETELRLGLLCCLRGVGVPVASAILTLVYPDRYAVIDYRGWSRVFGGKKKTSFLPSDYLRYLKRVRALAARLNWTVQETDEAIWEYDRRDSARRRRR
jgi:hypothetical protein